MSQLEQPMEEPATTDWAHSGAALVLFVLAGPLMPAR